MAGQRRIRNGGISAYRERLAAGRRRRGVRDADVGPSVVLRDALIEGQIRVNNGLHHLFGCHPRHSQVSSAPEAVLTGVFAAHRVVDRFAAVGRVNHNRLEPQQFLHFLKELSQPLQVSQCRRIWGVIQRPVVGDGQLSQGEMRGHLLPGSARTALPNPSAAATP